MCRGRCAWRYLNIWRRQFKRDQIAATLRVLVVTFNKTLRGYIEELARDQVPNSPDVQIELTTFGKWAYHLLRSPNVLSDETRRERIAALGAGVPLPATFLADEVEYATGRYLPESIDQYIQCRREGRGRTPRVAQPLRERIINEVIVPYEQWKSDRGYLDWNDLAVELLRAAPILSYDIVVVDEAQDFSANQIRAVMHHLREVHSVTFIVDGTQRIYPRFASWKEMGIIIPPGSSFNLSRNFRNTAEIAAFARPLVEKLDRTEDSMLPDLEACTRHGARPKVLAGRFANQVRYAIDYITSYIDLRTESVAFLQVRAGRWFDYTRGQLTRAGMAFIDITRQDDWPTGDENIALSTLHSAKGLEFDHVFILGLSSEVTPHGGDEADAELENYLRLVAMAVCRARNSVIVGYKPGEASTVVEYLAADTFDLETV